MDFYKIKTRATKKESVEVYPDFNVCRSKDLMIRGKNFYAIWDEGRQMWSTDEYDVQRLIDEELEEKAREVENSAGETKIKVRRMSDYSSRSWSEFKSYISNLSDNNHQLDERLTFANSKVGRKDYVSKRLSYPLEPGPYEAYDELISTLYSEKERAKLEWAIGAVVSGDAKDIQKFIVLYGEAGAGKSTILRIIQKLFEGYYVTFDAKALTSNNNAFSTEVFKTNPLVAIQHDGDLSRIEDNTKLNSIVSHEEMTMNEKYKASYMSKANCFLFMATNKPVKITDAKSGIIRRLIDVRPTGNRIPSKKYEILMSQIDFELGAIASHCLDVYRQMGKNYYNSYVPVDMMFKTDVFFNFVDDSYFIFKKQDGTTLKAAYALYKTYCDDSGAEFKLPMYKFREELKNYFRRWDSIARVDGKQVRSYYSGFKTEKFQNGDEKEDDPEHPYSLVLDSTTSLLDEMLSECPAQYGNSFDKPTLEWDKVTTKLKDLDTSMVHYVMLPENHIVIDFDLKDENGNKSVEKNIEAASKWPTTYAEFSKSGAGIHLHYIYDGDVTKLSRIYDTDIEIKTFPGKSSLRRKLSKCNNIKIRTLTGGLPLKGEKVINFDTIKDEQHLRNCVAKALRKEIWPNTTPNIDYINKVLEDAYSSGIQYDLTPMRPAVMAFAANSTHQSEYCLSKVDNMKFKSEDPEDHHLLVLDSKDERLIFFDVEVFKNLFIVCWKYQGEENEVVKMINPSAVDIEILMRSRLVGFNNRRYDNHILYARYLGYTNEQLFELSQRIINGSENGFFREAYNVSYTDIYDFSASGHKQSLKKWEIDLDIHHLELSFPWDKPVDESKWDLVATYCANDVIATEAVFNHLSGDFVAREILADISEGNVNDTTNSLSTKFIFGNDRNPQSQFVYTDLSTIFPGYEFNQYGIDKSRYNPGTKIVSGKSIYRGEDPSEGGLAYANEGMYFNVALLDIASMHPSSIEALNLFGDHYTDRFSQIKKARIYIKRREFDKVREMFDGKLNKYLDDESKISGLDGALKTVINSIYGLTSAKFDNKCRDPRNKDNIVAKRGSLFMIDLKHAVQEEGYTVVHIKTDSIKIANADDYIIKFVMDFGKKYQYEFEHEATYDRMCIVNDSTYIAKYDDKGQRNKGGKHANEWTATASQFAHPYVFKTLFSKEQIVFKDMCETKSVTTALYLDLNEGYPDVSAYEKEKSNLSKKLKKAVHEAEIKQINERIKELDSLISDGHNYCFVGKVGLFCPIKKGCGGGWLCRENRGKFDSATGAKDSRWLEAEVVKSLNKEKDINLDYYRGLVDDAIASISQYGDFEIFTE